MHSCAFHIPSASAGRVSRTKIAPKSRDLHAETALSQHQTRGKAAAHSRKTFADRAQILQRKRGDRTRVCRSLCARGVTSDGAELAADMTHVCGLDARVPTRAGIRLRPPPSRLKCRRSFSGRSPPTSVVPIALAALLSTMTLQPAGNGRLPAANITLHAADLEIENNTVTVNDLSSGDEIEVVNVAYDEAREFLILNTGSELQKGKKYVIKIQYTAFLKDNLKGFYRYLHIIF